MTALDIGTAPEDPPLAHSRGVPFFTQAASFAARWPATLAELAQVADDGKYSHGRTVARLEAALAAYTGARHVVAVNSGTDALVLLLRAAGLEPGDEVIVPAFTFFASASSVVLAGGRPVFVDIDPATYTLAPGAIAAATTKRTRFVMPVHLFCQMADMDGVRDEAARVGIEVVEDSAEAIGMRWGGRHAGLLGRGGVLSFFPTKTLGALGDAGAVLTDDDATAETAAALRHHGRRGPTLGDFRRINTETALPGVNSKMDDLQAAVLLAKLAHLDADIARRAVLAAAYDERLCGLRDRGMVRTPAVVRHPSAGDGVWYVYLVEALDRDDLAAHLQGLDIGTETYYPRPLHRQPCFAELGHRPGDFPAAEAASTRTLALPLYPDLTMEQVEIVCEAVEDFYDGRTR